MTSAVPSTPTPSPFRRRVFYIPGYDPVPPRRYRELFRAEAAKQARISGYELELVPGRPSGDGFGWRAEARIGGRVCETRFEVLGWADIVNASMAQGIGATYGQMLRTAWVYLSTGALWRLLRLRKGPVLAALYPLAMLMAQLLLAVAAGAGLALAVAIWLPVWLGLFAGLALVIALLRFFRRHDGRILAYYLMHDYAFTAAGRGANPPALDARLGEFRDRIAAAQTEDLDEVLVVGHSSGAHLAVSVLAGLLRDGQGAKRPALSLLTLGQVVPMVSFLPEARALRADLAALSVSPALSWVDVSAPGDGASFALCDPVTVSGVAGPGKRWPLVVSAAFSQTLAPERWKAMRWRFFRLHFQYLCAFDRPAGYDYFRITCGPKTLGAAFAGRQPSPQRIDHAVSGYRSLCP
ncbi:MAG: hypothetical protein R3D84_17320 [Paracoccaceae bacterium]